MYDQFTPYVQEAWWKQSTSNTGKKNGFGCNGNSVGVLSYLMKVAYF